MLSNTALFAQATIKGKVSADGMPLPLANVILKTLKKTTVAIPMVILSLKMLLLERMKFTFPILALNLKQKTSLSMIARK